MKRRDIAYEWLKLNEDKLQGLGPKRKWEQFERFYPVLYSEGGFKGLIEDISKGAYFRQELDLQPVAGVSARVYNKPVGDKFKVLIFSDCHGWLADLKALRCINKILQRNEFDEVVINGDIIDLPYISKHTQKLFPDGILKDYSEVGEIEYTKEQILKPLRHSTNANIRIRLGNHDERITKPNLLSDKQLQRLAVVYKHYQTTKLEEMLGVTGDGWIYDPTDVHTYFDKFHLVHGLSLAANASEKNIQEYMGSGSSGHTHRLGVYVKTNKKAPYVWLQSGHTRVGEQVEYFPTGKIPNWQQGFNVLTFYRHSGEWFVHWECVQIINGRCFYNGELFEG